MTVSSPGKHLQSDGVNTGADVRGGVVTASVVPPGITSLAIYKPRLLIDIFFPSSTLRISSEDIYVDDIFYENRLIETPEIPHSLPDVFYGIEEPVDITFNLSNTDGFLNSITDEIRNVDVLIRRYDPGDGDPIFECYGVIIDYNFLDVAEIIVSTQTQFQTYLPKKIYEDTDWPTGAGITNPKYDLGKAYNLCFGICKEVPLRYVHRDISTPGDYKFDYIIGNGIIKRIVNVYRNKVIVYEDEYAFFNGSQTSPYSGYAFIRFTTEQVDFDGNPYDIFADVEGLTFNTGAAVRNFPQVIEKLLSNPDYGLGLPIDEFSFALAAAKTIDLLCDGTVSEQRQAIDIINEMLYACRGRLSRDANGIWRIDINVANPYVAGTFGTGDTEYDNIVNVSERKKTQGNNCLKSITVKYNYSEWESTYRAQKKRQILAFGIDKIIEHPFVSDPTTADMIACYVQKYFSFGDEKLTIEVGMEGRNLKPRDVIQIKIPRYNINNTYQIINPQKRLNTFILPLLRYDPDIYVYTPE